MFMGYDIFAGIIKMIMTLIPFGLCGIFTIGLFFFKPSRDKINKWFDLEFDK